MEAPFDIMSVANQKGLERSWVLLNTLLALHLHFFRIRIIKPENKNNAEEGEPANIVKNHRHISHRLQQTGYLE